MFFQLKLVQPMGQTEAERNRQEGDDEPDVVAESRGLQRKLVFWRRAAGMLLGIALIVGIVLWQRAELQRRACAESLNYYAKLARETHLEEQPPRLLEAQWQTLNRLPKADPKPVSPKHYSLIVDNWDQTPRAGDSLPLAVCNYPHWGLFAKGRHVLYHDGNGFHIEWVAEDLAAPIAAAARGEPSR
jgi:hypothetical protein